MSEIIQYLNTSFATAMSSINWCSVFLEHFAITSNSDVLSVSTRIGIKRPGISNEAPILVRTRSQTYCSGNELAIKNRSNDSPIFEGFKENWNRAIEFVHNENYKHWLSSLVLVSSKRCIREFRNKKSSRLMFKENY